VVPSLIGSVDAVFTKPTLSSTLAQGVVFSTPSFSGSRSWVVLVPPVQPRTSMCVTWSEFSKFISVVCRSPAWPRAMPSCVVFFKVIRKMPLAGIV